MLALRAPNLRLAEDRLDDPAEKFYDLDVRMRPRWVCLSICSISEEELPRLHKRLYYIMLPTSRRLSRFDYARVGKLSASQSGSKYEPRCS